MDPAFQDALRRGLDAFRLAVPAEALPLLERFADRLLAWNRKVNLTRITAPAEVAEKHLVDALLLLPAIAGARTLLDVGSGAGIPGVPVACARRDLDVTCCDSVTKKVAFVKAVSAELDVRVRAVAVRAEGDPERERLPRCDAVVSRALADPEAWVPLGARYLADGGVLLAMLGREADRGRLAEIGRGSGLALASLDAFVLPVSRSARAIAAWRRA
ncbi:MAG TPA: 16S rRNA (guanine(527)-N(7))-methyltransferase RsmG [Anaeromyxobacter sp.]